MKKNQYIQPTTEIVNVEIQHNLLDASNVYTNDNNIRMNSATMDEGDGSDGASRGSFWDD